MIGAFRKVILSQLSRLTEVLRGRWPSLSCLGLGHIGSHSSYADHNGHHDHEGSVMSSVHELCYNAVDYATSETRSAPETKG